ncbi:hypothetical protein MASR1M29_20540 [Cloacibacterium normanense]
MKIRLKMGMNGLLKSRKWQLKKTEVVVLAAQIEADINELETFEERQMFLEELGLEEPGVNRLIEKIHYYLQHSAGVSKSLDNW